MYQTDIKTHKGTVHLTSWDDVGQFARDCMSLPDCERWGDFTGGETRKGSFDKCINGDKANIGNAQGWLDKVMAEGIDLPRKFWRNSIAGAFPNVPSFLAGEQETMFQLRDEADDASPMKIFVSLTSSEGADVDSLTRRGTAVLALLMGLTQIRPVELWLFSELDSRGGGASVQLLRVNTTPLDLSVASFLLTSQGVPRGFMMEVAYKFDGFPGGWAFNIYDTEKRLEALKPALGFTDKDLALGGAFLDDEVCKKPLIWLNKMLKKYASVLAD